ncbi:MAG TPA: hypothetical protein VF162_05465 [Streptosporangiaceae bacterium]
MSLYALVSPGGSAGCTTTALALALTWPRPVILAECDPAGGDILAGLFAGHMPAPRGLLGVAFEAGRGVEAMSVEAGAQLAALDGSGTRMFLAGLSDPRQAPGLAPAWPAIGRMLSSQPCDVIADCGRLDAGDGQPSAVLAAAQLVAMVLRSSLRQIAAARPRIEMLARLLGGSERLGLVLVGDKSHSYAEISRTLGVPVLASIALDARTAAVLSDGVGRRTNLADRPLMRAAMVAGAAITKAARDAMPLDLAVTNGHLA